MQEPDFTYSGTVSAFDIVIHQLTNSLGRALRLSNQVSLSFVVIRNTFKKQNNLDWTITVASNYEQRLSIEYKVAFK